MERSGSTLESSRLRLRLGTALEFVSLMSDIHLIINIYKVFMKDIGRMVKATDMEDIQTVYK